MKTHIVSTLSVAVICSNVLVSPRLLATQSGSSTIPSMPAGALSAYPTVAQTGTRPTLTWGILYPSKVSDLVVVQPPGTLIPNATVYATVQIVGSRVSGSDAAQGSTPISTDARVSLNGGSYQQLFFGSQADVDPAKQLYIKKLAANETLNFGGRYVSQDAWTPFYTTQSSNMQVVALVNGSTPPTRLPLYQSSTLAGYLKPYLDASGQVSIGPMSVLILMELGQTSHSSSSFDYQDQVLLVTFSLKHPNDGHGNNLDGVDVSNPGQGHGGPNGEVDPSGGVDDEIK